MTMDLFNNPEPIPVERIRTLGFYQPYGSLMLHGKIETRWVAHGKKPPFPLGKYLFYTTKKRAYADKQIEWSGIVLASMITVRLAREPTVDLNGYAIGLGVLKEVRLLTKADESRAFVEYKGQIGVTSHRPNQQPEFFPWKTQWALVFEDVQRIEPFEWKHGKQGVGFVPEELLSRIKPIS